MLRNIAISGRLSPLVCSSLFLPQLLFPVNDYKLIGGFLSGVAYTSECFQCKPGTYSAKPGSARCTPCPAETYSNKGATVCLQCDQDKYSGMLICISNALSTKTDHIIDSLTWHNYCNMSKLCVLPHTHTHMQSDLHANTARAANVVAECVRFVLSLDLNVSCVLSLFPAWSFPLTWFLFFQRLVQGAANRDLRVQTATTSTPTLPVTLRER